VFFWFYTALLMPSSTRMVKASCRCSRNNVVQKWVLRANENHDHHEQ